MSDALSFAEINRQSVELLPTRTVLSLFSVGVHGAGNNDDNGDGGSEGAGGNEGAGGSGGHGGAGGAGWGGLGI
ncbi:MAG: hypothetical protein M3Y48_16330 [Actinomycetota bacterium]|nr:hypothetical protein [Actinomycetota bacterium]